jgi:hypothetical protein
MGAASFGLLSIINILFTLVLIIFFVIVVIKQFKDAGPVHGIIGIVTCGIWTFIWGWMNAARLNIKNLMMIWTLVLVLCVIFRVILITGMLASSGSMAPTP